MTGPRLLVCLDASSAALAAARYAIDLAADLKGRVRLVSVVGEDETSRRLDRRGGATEPAGERRVRGIEALQTRLRRTGEDRGVTVEAEILSGDPLREILRDARAWEADVLLIGRSDRPGPGSAMLGSLAMHVVELSDLPVVVVPEAPPR